VVKRIFALAAAGYGHKLIVKTLTQERVAPFGKAGWTKSYVCRILTDRRALVETRKRSLHNESGFRS
jgi:Recombinase